MVKKRHLYIVIGILFVGLILGSFFDLQINQAIYSKNNTFCLIMASFGTYPCYAGLSFIGGGLFATSIKRKDLHIAWKIISWIGGAFTFGLSIYLGSKDFPSINGFNNPDLKIPSYTISSIVFIGVGVLGFFICSKSDNKEKLWIILFAMALVYALGLLPVSYLIKLFIHRPRFRFLVSTETIGFHNWWESYKNYKEYLATNPIVDGIAIGKEEFKSFPSGHSGSAAILMMLLPYSSFFFKKMKGKEVLMFYIGFAFTLLMMFTRLLCGAHYLSDTCMGALIVMVVYLIIQIFVQSKGWLDKPENAPAKEEAAA